VFTIRRTDAAWASLTAGVAGLCVSAFLGVESCAYVAAPPGGPADSIPPMVVLVEPDSFSVNPGFDGDVRFEFDESISERGIEGSTVLYPFEARPQVKKGKRELKVRPREGWVDDRIYHIRVNPNIQDLFNNRIENPLTYTFSTGLPIPNNGVQGTVTDRITGQPLRSGRIDMVRTPDTLRYGSVADTAGEFALRALPLGDYLAIGYQDVNGNQRADEFDRSDTLEVELAADGMLALDFHVFRHDTLPPQLAVTTAVDTITVELQFNSYIDPDSPLSVADVAMYGAVDTVAVAIDTVLHAWEYAIWRDSVAAVIREAQAAERARLDSLAAVEAGDTLAAEADTLERAPPPQVLQAEEEGEEEPEEVEEPPRLPDERIFVITAGPIPSAAHIVTIQNILSLSGLIGGGEMTFQPVEPEPEEEEEPPGEPPG
jgi:hypothetical protein